MYETRTRAGQTSQLTYDALNRMVGRTLAGNTTTYGYDISGRTVTAADNAGTLRSTFDRLGRVDTVTQTNGATVSYLYDELGQRTQLTYPDGNSVTYGYDSLGRLTDINDPNGDSIAHYEYDDLSRRVSVSYANGTSASYTYNHSDRLTQLHNATTTGATTYGYSYDLVGNRTNMLVNGTDQHNYSYDNIYQLTNVDYPDAYFQADTAFTYDDAGNRSQVDSPPTTYTTNNLNQYTYVGSETYDYDNNGNLTSDGQSSYTYNAQNQLISAAVASRTVQYTYDAAGRRICKDVDGRITQYVYDGDEVIAEYDGEGILLRTFVYGPGIDEPICLYVHDLAVGDITGDGVIDLEDLLALAGKWLLTSQDPGYDPLYDLDQDGRIDNADTDLLSAHWRTQAEPVQVFYYHFDGLGSVVALSDAAGNVVETYAYDVYGRSRPTGFSHGNPYRFTARRWEPEIGLYDYRARYYNPQIGRFLQTDPIGYADGINWYAYCGNNPILLVDPSGLGSQMASGGGPNFLSQLSSGQSRADYATQRISEYRRNGGTFCGACHSGALDDILPRDIILARDVVAPMFAYTALVAGAGVVSSAAATAATTAGPALTADGLLAVNVASTGAAGGGVSAYQAINAVGKVVYVGITNDFVRRSGEQLRNLGVAIERIPGLTNLTRIQARGVEQALINLHGLARNGGTLLNKINSIAMQNPIYQSAVQFGTEVLKSINYPGAGGG